jgi:hypothetical protein
MTTVVNKVKKSVKSYNEVLIESFGDDIESTYIPQIKELIMADYDSELVDVVTNRKSKTNPLFYREEFEVALNEFEYIVQNKDYITLIIPDVDNFPWSKGKLKIILNILEGTSGIYVEVTEEQYIQMYSKRPLSVEPYDKTVPRKERIYLLRYTSKVQRREKEVFNRRVLVRYPFSNFPPIELFEPTIKFVESNFKIWLADSMTNTTKEYSKKGVH